ncbi:HAD family hydrolase [Hymenobacter glacieicola]|uniref:phosphoglycolate phosphatase n=1 Tax=Hymenobacter glacieicola TaxID=1562124 RepID=A0ABQ1X120_9BACT|nr:HAD family hydrolase [Hymenobacter glacieicola]GGG54238.1 haloacid dehalogenase [Hymenobacter glacieicola]
MSYSLLLFDYDGTLCDTRAAIKYSLRRTFQEFGYSKPVEPALRAVVQQGLPLAATLLGLHPAGTGPLPATWTETYRRIYRAEAEQLVRPFPGAQQVLAAAVALGCTVVVISNKGLAILENSLARLGLREYAALVLGDDPTATAPLPLKPDPALFTQRIQPRFPQFTSSSTLMIGDTATDLQFAQNCGIAACWASYGFGHAAECAAFKPVHRISSLTELLPLLTQ